MALIDVRHFALARAFRGGRGEAAADDAGFDAFPTEPLEADAVLRIEALGFDHLAFGIGHIVEVAVGENAVHIHQQQLDLGSARLGIHPFS